MSHRRRQTLLLITAMALLVVSCTESSEPTASTAAATTAVSTTVATRPVVDPESWLMADIVDGEDVAWQLDLESDLELLGIITIGGQTYFLATSPGDGGLWVWRTADGAAIDDLGQVLTDRAQVAAVGDNGDEILAVTRSTGEEPPALWRSSDGIVWSSQELSFDTDNPLLRFDPQAVGGTPALTVVAAGTSLDADAYLRERMIETVYSDFDPELMGFAWSTGLEDVFVDVTVPPGLRIARFTGAELGLTDTEKAWLRAEPSSSEPDLFVLVDRGDWQVTSIPDVTRIDKVFGTPQGDVLVAGATPTPNPIGQGTAVYRTFEGLSWERLTSAERPGSSVEWGTQLVGIGTTGENDLLVSSDGQDWAATGLERRFPASLSFNITEVGAGPNGVVAVAESPEWPSDKVPDIEIPRLEQEGLTVVLESTITSADRPPQISTISIVEGTFEEGFVSDPVYFPVPGEVERDDLAIDMETRTVTFRDTSGADWITLDFGQLEDLVDSADVFRKALGTGHGRAIAFSRDTEQWDVRDLTSLVGDGLVAGVAHTGDRVVVAIDREPGFEIWSVPHP